MVKKPKEDISVREYAKLYDENVRGGFKLLKKIYVRATSFWVGFLQGNVWSLGSYIQIVRCLNPIV